MRILIVTTSFPSRRPGEFLGKFVLNEARAYSENGAEVSVLTPHYPGVPATEQFQPRLVVHRFRYVWPVRWETVRRPHEPLYGRRSLAVWLQLPLFLACFVLQILRRARHADILHCQWTVCALLALPAKWLLGKPLVLTARGSDIRLLPKWLNRFIHRRMTAVIDCYGPQEWNERNKRDFPARTITLPLLVPCDRSARMPADMAARTAAHPDALRLLFVSRMNLEYFRLYGHPGVTLLETARTLREQGTPVLLFYIGDGEAATMAELRRLVAENDLNETVFLLGPRHNVGDYLPYADLGAGGSAFATVSQEFSMFGVPQLLARGHDNVNTPWRDRENALFFTAGDSDSLTATIRFAQADRERLRAIGAAAQRLMSRYVKDIGEGGRLYCRAFQRLLDGDLDDA